MSFVKAAAALLILSLCVPGTLQAQTTTSADSAPPQPLLVGLFDAPPFAEAMTQPSGKVVWEGTSIRLLDAIAEEMGVKVAYRTGSESEILAALSAGEIDICASPLAPTAKSMRAFQFSYAYTAVGIAAATRVNSSVQSDFELLITALKAPSRSHLYTISLIALGIFALLVWFAERRKGGHFERHPWRGIGASLWWSIVTLATVGYGDKVPQSFTGRLLACAWMLASLILTALVTATIVGALTTHGLNRQPFRSSADLLHARVAAVRTSVAADWLTTLNAPFLQADTLDAALQLLEQERVDVVVAPELPLAQEIRGHAELQMMQTRFAEEYMCFGIAKKFDAAFMQRFNIALVDSIPRLARSDAPRAVSTLADSPRNSEAAAEPTP